MSRHYRIRASRQTGVDGGQGWLDAFWPKHLAIEHKSAGRSLEEAIDQAVDYLGSLKQSDWPRYVMSSDFQNFLILDLETSEKIAFPLTELPQRLEMFGWIAGYQRRSFAQEDEVNVHAAELMGRLYDLLDASGYGDHDLDLLLVRLVFIMFADDTERLGEEPLHRLPDRPDCRGRGGHRTAPQSPLPGARHTEEPAPDLARRGPSALPAHQWRPVR